MEFLAPAKVNLSLRVLERREDGFHNIETLMVPVSIFDTLEIEHSDRGGIEFSCTDPTLPVDSTNLVVRAIEHFCSSLGFQPHLHVRLKKEIPQGAGLGGGSSDAATVLIALNHIFRTELPRTELSALAAELGSDVPFFIHQSAAWCRGRGEIVEPCASPSISMLLIKPPFGVATPWAYKNWTRSKKFPTIHRSTQKLTWGELLNDLETPVFEKYIQLAEIKRWLLGEPEVSGALMSGSGSTLFAILNNPSAGMTLAAKAVEQFGKSLWLACVETL